MALYNSVLRQRNLKWSFSSVNPVIIFPDPGTVYTINEGESIHFECEAYGIPPPMLSFEYEVPLSMEMLARTNTTASLEAYVIPATGEEVILSRGIAVLISATDGDSGNYTCIINSTTPETDRVTVTLVVQGTYFSVYIVQCIVVCFSSKDTCMACRKSFVGKMADLSDCV